MCLPVLGRTGKRGDWREYPLVLRGGKTPPAPPAAVSVSGDLLIELVDTALFVCAEGMENPRTGVGLRFLSCLRGETQEFGDYCFFILSLGSFFSFYVYLFKRFV